MLRLTMPAQCPEKYPDSTATVTIKLYVKDRRTIYIDKDSVPWAVQYLHDQWTMGGIPAVVQTPQPMAPAPPAVAGIAHDSIPPTTPTRTISWIFCDNAWQLNDRSDTKTVKRQLRPDEVTFDEASTVVDISGPSALNAMTYEANKSVAYDIMARWAATLD